MTMEAPKHDRMSTDQQFRLYAPFVSRFLLRLGVGEDAVDDAVQEVFLVAHRSSHATFYLSGQELSAGNVRAVFVRDAP